MASEPVQPGATGNNCAGAAGIHFIADFRGAIHLCDCAALDRALRAAVKAAGANLLHLHLHSFGDGDGVTGVALLSESHISIHTWPERDFAALDVFMCGDANPEVAIEVLSAHLRPTHIDVRRILRGGANSL